jgi:tetratricopeptide (TPR) repeat protein
MALLAICAHIQTRFWHDSESLFRHTLSINPTSVAAAVNLGKLRADQADTFKAQGRVNEAMTRSDEAISLYKRALASSPNDADVLKNLGHMYKLQQRWPEAEIQYRAVLTLRPNDAETHVQLGVVLGNQGRITDAIEEFREALSIERDYAVARNLLDQAIRMLPQSRPANP